MYHCLEAKTGAALGHCRCIHGGRGGVATFFFINMGPSQPPATPRPRPAERSAMASITVVGLDMVPRDEPQRDTVVTEAVPTEQKRAMAGTAIATATDRDESENTDTGSDTIDLNLMAQHLRSRQRAVVCCQGARVAGRPITARAGCSD
jgi:hypothetical protein